MEVKLLIFKNSCNTLYHHLYYFVVVGCYCKVVAEVGIEFGPVAVEGGEVGMYFVVGVCFVHTFDSKVLRNGSLFDSVDIEEGVKVVVEPED